MSSENGPNGPPKVRGEGSWRAREKTAMDGGERENIGEKMAKSVRFSGDEPDVRHIMHTEEGLDTSMAQYGSDDEDDVSGNLVKDLSRTSVRAEELEEMSDEIEDGGESSRDVTPQNTLKRKKSVTFAQKMARAWEIKPEEVLIEELLGNGAYGQVYKGKWSGTEVAVKIVQEDLVYQQQYISSQEISDAMKVRAPLPLSPPLPSPHPLTPSASLWSAMDRSSGPRSSSCAR